MNKIAIALSVCLLLSTAVGCASAITDTEKPFIVAMGLAYPPFETKDSAGNPSGVSVDFAKAFGEYIGREVRIENIAWDGLIPSLQTGKADMIVSSMTITEKRKEMVDFSDPYANALLAILANKNSGISYIDDLNQPGKKGRGENRHHGRYLRPGIPLECRAHRTGGRERLRHRGGAGQGGRFHIRPAHDIPQLGDPQRHHGGRIHPVPGCGAMGRGCKKGNRELLNKLNTFIAKFRSEGGFDKLTEKFLAKEKAAFEELGFQWFFDLK